MIDFNNIPKKLKTELETKFKFDENNWNLLPDRLVDITNQQKRAGENILDWLSKNYINWIEENKKEEYKNKIKQLKELADKTNLTLKTNFNCGLCALNIQELHAGIFFEDWDTHDVNQYFENENKTIRFNEEDIQNHKKHIIVTPINVAENMKKVKQSLLELKDFSKLDANNIEILQSRINLLSALIYELEKQGMAWSQQYIELNKILMQFVDLKNKITDGEKINMNVEYKTLKDIIGGDENDSQVFNIKML